MQKNFYDVGGECLKSGQSAEDQFEKLIAGRGSIRPASFFEQTNSHFDFLLTTQSGKTISYEVKARKKLKRADEKVNDSKIWVEIVGITGKPGWVYGKANYLVFEQENDFIIVDRKKLVDFIEKTCDLNDVVNDSYRALYKGYKRQNRLDLITLVYSRDIRNIASEILKK